MKLSLRVKLSAAFVAVTLLVFLLVGVLANLLLERQFKQYVIGNRDKLISDAVGMLAERYDTWGSRWDVSGIETIGMNALGDGLILRLADAQGAVVWDARTHNGGMCAALLEHMAVNMQSHSAGFKGGYTEQAYPLSVGGAAVGTATVGYYGPYYYTDSDLNFLGTLNRLLLWAAGAAALAALAFGVAMARRLARPIANVVHATRRIADGDYAGRVAQPSGTAEIAELADSVNSLAQALGVQDTLRKRLTADVAHELRTPLATLQSHLEAMMDGVWQPNQERLASCHEEAMRLSRLVGDLENLSVYEAEGLKLAVSEFDVSALLRRVVTNFENPYISRGVRLAFTPEPHMVNADEDKLSQVFVNLLSNALKYTPAGGSVAVDVSETGDTVLIRISDTGIGIPEQDLKNIFERFYRADPSRSRSTGGSGIGLTIARAIVEAHGGRIAVESKPDEGSVFTVSLPKSHE